MPIQSKQQPPYYQQATPIKKYVAIISQITTGNITAIELENTIGTLVWSRVGAGDFLLTATGLFTLNKTWIANSESLGYGSYPLSSTAVNAEFYTFKIDNVNNINIQFFNATYNNVDPSTLLGDGFTLCLPEIRVYP